MSDEPEVPYDKWVHILMHGCLKNWMFYAGAFLAFWSAFGYMESEEIASLIRDVAASCPQP